MSFHFAGSVIYYTYKVVIALAVFALSILNSGGQRIPVRMVKAAAQKAFIEEISRVSFEREMAKRNDSAKPIRGFL